MITIKCIMCKHALSTNFLVFVCLPKLKLWTKILLMVSFWSNTGLLLQLRTVLSQSLAYLNCVCLTHTGSSTLEHMYDAFPLDYFNHVLKARFTQFTEHSQMKPLINLTQLNEISDFYNQTPTCVWVYIKYP